MTTTAEPRSRFEAVYQIAPHIRQLLARDLPDRWT